jgi:hypothetical protein
MKLNQCTKFGNKSKSESSCVSSKPNKKENARVQHSSAVINLQPNYH